MAPAAVAKVTGYPDAITRGGLRGWAARRPVASFLILLFSLAYPIMSLPVLAAHGVIPDGWMPQLPGLDTERIAAAMLVLLALLPTTFLVTWAADGGPGVLRLVRRMPVYSILHNFGGGVSSRAHIRSGRGVSGRLPPKKRRGLSAVESLSMHTITQCSRRSVVVVVAIRMCAALGAAAVSRCRWVSGRRSSAGCGRVVASSTGPRAAGVVPAASCQVTNRLD